MELLEMDHHHETAKQAADALSIATVLGTLMNWLPAVAALASLVWSIIRIYETQTVQNWVNKNADSK